MIRWELLDTAEMPGGGELKLMRRGNEYSIMSGPTELMNSRLSGSEEALATLSCARLTERRAPQVLIGGLGMGFTLRAALAALGPHATVTVAELTPAVVAWAKDPMAGVFGDSLSDPRTHIHVGDVGDLIRSAQGTYDAILLDVDNGPEGLTRKANDSLYDMEGLNAARQALRPGGIFAVWSSAPHPVFSKRLRTCGYRVEETRVRANAGRSGARHVIWLATR